MNNENNFQSIIDEKILLEALDLYEEDFINEVEAGGEYNQEERNTYNKVADLHDLLMENIKIQSINDFHIGALLNVLQYYIRVRAEDLEGACDKEQQEHSEKVIPIARKMSSDLEDLLIDIDKLLFGGE